MALDRAAPSAPHPLEGDHCLALLWGQQTGGWGEEAATVVQGRGPHLPSPVPQKEVVKIRGMWALGWTLPEAFLKRPSSALLRKVFVLCCDRLLMVEILTAVTGEA